MRNIYVLRHVNGRVVAFSQLRAAERHVESIVKERWAEVTDMEAIAARAEQEFNAINGMNYREPVRNQYLNRARAQLATNMERARQWRRSGYRRFRQEFPYNYTSLPSIETVPMYRSLAEFRRA